METDFLFSFSDDLLSECPSASRITLPTHVTNGHKRPVPDNVAPPGLSKDDEAYWLARADRKARRTGPDGKPRVRDRKRNPRPGKGRRGGVFKDWIMSTFKLKEKQAEAEARAAAIAGPAAVASPSADSPSADSAPAPAPAPAFPALPPFHVVDVAGGRGQIAFYLAAFEDVPVSVIDPVVMQVSRFAERYHQQRVAKRKARVQHMRSVGIKRGEESAAAEKETELPPELVAAFAAAASLSTTGVDASAPFIDPATGVRMPVPWLPHLHHYQCLFPDSIALSLHKQYARANSSDDDEEGVHEDEAGAQQQQEQGATADASASPAATCCAVAAPASSPDAAAALSATLAATLSSAHMLYGMHADGATEALVDFALAHDKPFAVVPCCVFPDAAPHRRVRKRVPVSDAAAPSVAASSSASAAAPSISSEEWVPVRTYDQFLDYLQAKHPSIQRVDLQFAGRNTCIFRTMP